MEQATLMFGIGATKAGTSWLYRYLCAHPECAMPATKELHYFDSDTPRKLETSIADVQAQIDRALEKAETKEGLNQAFYYMHIEGLRQVTTMLKAPRGDDRAYMDYLSEHVADGAKLVGDITPSYALVPADRLMEMSRLAPKTRFIYILRDPVDRLWSNVRMAAARRLEAGQSLNELANRIMETVVIKGMRPGLLERSDYAGTLQKLDEAVPEENRKVVFFERLFNENTIRDICAFLGLSYQPADFDKKIHAGRASAMRQDLKIAARALLDDQYKAVERRFGDLPTRWQRDMAKVSA